MSLTLARSLTPLALFGLLLPLQVGCSDGDDGSRSDPSSSSSSSGSGGSGGAAGECAAVGATQCSGTEVQTCEEQGGALVWGAAAPCPGEQSCQGGACADPTEQQLSQVASMEAYADALVDNSGWPLPIDGEALKKAERATILQGDGSDATFFGSMRRVHLAVPQGHQSLYLADQDACGTPAMFYQNQSRFGVCGRPRGDAIVITFAEPGNPLGLSAGDLVVAADDDTGPDLLEASAQRPVCGANSPSDIGRKTAAAASFFGTVPAGTTLTVKAVAGGERTVVVPEQDGSLVSCQDALGRDIEFNASATLRPDGIAVIRLPRFYPIDQTLPQNPTLDEVEAFIAEFQQKIADVFDTVKDAPGLIWDARGNYGGISRVGLAIAAGMPTAQATSISYCTQRVPASSPPEFYPQKYAAYDVVPGGPFAYAGKVAVIVDGLDYSAADYFPLAIGKATATPLVGTGTAGAYGGPGPMEELPGPPGMLFNYDVNRCLDAATDQPLEGTVTVPDVEVEYDPADLAAGVDTLLEAAVLLVE